MPRPSLSSVRAAKAHEQQKVIAVLLNGLPYFLDQARLGDLKEVSLLLDVTLAALEQAEQANRAVLSEMEAAT